jgi:hypothetical protein
VSSVVSVGFVMEGQLALLWWDDGVVSERAPCGVCCCMLCVSWAEHWRLKGMFVLMKVLVRFGWHIFGFDGHPAAIVAGEGDVCGSGQGSNTEVWLNRLVSASRSVGGGRLMRLFVIGHLKCVAERGCVADVAWVGTLC